MMAKGEPRLAGVTVDRDAPGDPRYVHLAKLLRLANHYEALGRMIVLWSTCTALKTDTPPRAKIVVCFGDDAAPDALVAADLAVQLSDGQVRVKGTKGRLDWFEDLPSQQRQAGLQRAASAERGPGGKFAPKDVRSGGYAGGPLDVAGPATVQRSQRQPAQEQEQGPDGAPSDVHSSSTGPSGDPDLGVSRDLALTPPPADRAGPRDSGARVPPAPPVPAVGGSSSASPTRQAEEVRLVRELYAIQERAFNAIRDRHGLQVPRLQPPTLGDAAERDLRQLIRDQVSLEGFEERARHVIAVREKEADDKRTLQYFGARMWAPSNFATTLTMQIGEDRRKPPDPRHGRAEPASAAAFQEPSDLKARQAARREGKP
jgi:hypothetical protein